MALYDIDGARLKESAAILAAINKGKGSKSRIVTYLGTEQRKDALRGASFVVNAIQVGGSGVNPCRVGRLPVQLAAMNMTNINVHLLAIEAAHTQKREHIYHAAMLEPHTAAELSPDDIVSMVDELIDAHGDWLPEYI